MLLPFGTSDRSRVTWTRSGSPPRNSGTSHAGRATVSERNRDNPEDGPLKAYLKNHERYADLNSQSSQRVIEELAEAFHGWYAKRRNGDDRANPPKYRKNGDDHPRSTVTFKEDGFKYDAKNNRIRLSKGRNLKGTLVRLHPLRNRNSARRDH